jgi:hypothetical protein
MEEEDAISFLKEDFNVKFSGTKIIPITETETKSIPEVNITTRNRLIVIMEELYLPVPRPPPMS